MGKLKTTVAVFDLPQRLGIPQYVEYEPARYSLYTGLLTAEGCRRGVCVRYRVWVSSQDGRRWEAKERWGKRRDEDSGGCLRQQVADALWELAERGLTIEIDNECNVVINGATVPRPRCRTADECVRQMLEEYKKKLESPPPPRRSPEEEEYEALLQRYAWLGWWSRNAVLDTLRRGRYELLSLLQRLDSVPHLIKLFLGRFDLDLRCLVDIYSGAGGYCVSFCVKDFDPRTYCYEPGRGWYAAPQPKFIKLKPLEGGNLVEVYAVEGKELIRIA